jgi:hypothetical protein
MPTTTGVGEKKLGRIFYREISRKSSLYNNVDTMCKVSFDCLEVSVNRYAFTSLSLSF